MLYAMSMKCSRYLARENSMAFWYFSGESVNLAGSESFAFEDVCSVSTEAGAPPFPAGEGGDCWSPKAGSDIRSKQSDTQRRIGSLR